MTQIRGPRQTGATPGVPSPELSAALIAWLASPRPVPAGPPELVQDTLPGMEPEPGG